ncbi:MAG: hypothetical protein JO126_06830 [Alphaproteobacteria bacterium]|nr:hypothetical protein [Alphaproteobacteria bacterium]MBV8549153.1 hypothetical protein [Alphaproteobacteria bacterium]
MFARLTFFFFLLLIAVPARAETLRYMVGDLDVLPLHYGTNDLHISGDDLLIVRGVFETGTAWGGDVYTVLIKNGDAWEMVRYEKNGWSGVLTKTQPHTFEDSIVTVRFMVPKGTSKSGNVSSLYVLKAARPYLQNAAGKTDPEARETPANFTLYVLQRDKDFGIPYLHEVARARSKNKYCNADWAVWRELGVTLPDNSGTYECVGE